jgi:RHS repeat-associated protein
LKIRNLYDDRGFRLAKVSYGETSARTTWYIRDASGTVLSIYEQEGEPGIGNTHQVDQTEVPVYGASKLGTYYPNQDGSMAYEITDHLGNVRALIRDNVNVYMATMEDSEEQSLSNPRIEEMQYFENLFSTAVPDDHMNHTPPISGREEHPDKSAYLYWAEDASGTADPEKSIGPSIALKVRAGDKISLKVWARYAEKEDYTNDVPLAAFMQLLGADLLAMPVLDGVPAANTSAGLDAALTDLLGRMDSDEAPRAFLNYIVFDENMVGVAKHRVQVTTDAGFDPTEIAVLGQHEELKDSVEVTANGYIYVWLSNGSEATKVWFDDLTVMHTGDVVTQATDYGVWGDVLREEKLDETKYRYAYQGQFAELDKETGWSHFESREFDPVIGRWLVPDPAGQHWSPYLAMGNNPVVSVDPNGEIAGTIIGAAIGAGIAAWNGENVWKGALSGAVAGATFDLIVGSAVATGGASLPFIIGAGAVSGAAGAMTEQVWDATIEGRGWTAFSAQKTLTGAVWGAAAPMAGKLVGKLVGVAASKVSMMFTKSGIGVGPAVQIPMNATPEQAVAALGDDIALGLRADLNNFASSNGFKTYRNFSSGFQQDKILAAMENANNRLHFNLTDFSRGRYYKYTPTIGEVSHGNITNWELHTVLNNPSILGRTTFYKFSEGSYNVVAPPKY